MRLDARTVALALISAAPKTRIAWSVPRGRHDRTRSRTTTESSPRWRRHGPRGEGNDGVDDDDGDDESRQDPVVTGSAAATRRAESAGRHRRRREVRRDLLTATADGDVEEEGVDEFVGETRNGGAPARDGEADLIDCGRTRTPRSLIRRRDRGRDQGEPNRSCEINHPR